MFPGGRFVWTHYEKGDIVRVLNLKAQGYDVASIADMTGFSYAVVRYLRDLTLIDE